jgi:hypothetical protein
MAFVNGAAAFIEANRRVYKGLEAPSFSSNVHEDA